MPLSISFNTSFQSGVLPQDWKVAYIAPIHKKGSCNVTGNYTPVSLMSTIIVKTMESIVKSSIFDYLISNNLISSNQFGFLPDHSCTKKLLILYHTTDDYVKLRAMVLVGNF